MVVRGTREPQDRGWQSITRAPGGLRRRFYRDARQSARFPESGRAVPEYELATIRELVQAPYRMFYEVQADRIETIALVHGARDLSAG